MEAPRSDLDILKDILSDDRLDETFPDLREAFDHTKNHPPSAAPPPQAGTPRGGPQFFDVIATFGGKHLISGLLNHLRKRNNAVFTEAYNLLDADLKKKLDGFLSGTPIEKLFDPKEKVFNVPVSQPSKEKFLKLDKASQRQAPPVARSMGGQARGDLKISCVTDDEFTNWGATVKNTPELTWVAPTKISQLQRIVCDAKTAKKRVRAAGYRHSWSSIFSADQQILVSMLDQGLVERLPNTTSIQCKPADYGDNDFKIIQFLGAYPDNDKKGLVKVGAAVTNEDFRRWAVNTWIVDKTSWTLPLNVIMVEITFGGSNAPICHGAGIDKQTLSDLVKEIEYVDANGELQQISDPQELQAAAGCFGLLGIVTSLTLEVDTMTYAELNPQYKDLLLTIPPPPDFQLPKALQARYEKLKTTPQVLDRALKEFINTAETSYYAEWFWFPYQKEAFINAWNKTDVTNFKDVVDYPSKVGTWIEWLSGWAGEVVNNSLFMDCSWFFTPERQACIMGMMAMYTLPKQKVKTLLIDALHFRRGIQNMRVGDFEVEIPIPPTTVGGNTRDWRVVQRAWWDAVAAMYADRDVSARIALEMRVTGSSNILLAPQHGNNLGTASIEVITNMPAVKDSRRIWAKFKQTLADIWLNYEGPDQQKLKVRPHMAKEWTETMALEKDWVTHLREQSKAEIQQFTGILKQIANRQGYPYEDLQARFSTPLLDKLIFEPFP